MAMRSVVWWMLLLGGVVVATSEPVVGQTNLDLKKTTLVLKGHHSPRLAGQVPLVKGGPYLHLSIYYSQPHPKRAIPQPYYSPPKVWNVAIPGASRSQLKLYRYRYSRYRTYLKARLKRVPSRRKIPRPKVRPVPSQKRLKLRRTTWSERDFYLLVFFAKGHRYKVILNAPQIRKGNQYRVHCRVWKQLAKQLVSGGAGFVHTPYYRKVVQLLGHSEIIATSQVRRLSAMELEVDGKRRSLTRLKGNERRYQMGHLVGKNAVFYFHLPSLEYRAYVDRLEKKAVSQKEKPFQVSLGCRESRRQVRVMSDDKGWARLDWGKITSVERKSFVLPGKIRGAIVHRYGRPDEPFLNTNRRQFPAFTAKSRKEIIQNLYRDIELLYHHDLGYILEGNGSTRKCYIAREDAWTLSWGFPRYKLIKKVCQDRVPDRAPLSLPFPYKKLQDFLRVPKGITVKWTALRRYMAVHLARMAVSGWTVSDAEAFYKLAQWAHRRKEKKYRQDIENWLIRFYQLVERWKDPVIVVKKRARKLSKMSRGGRFTSRSSSFQKTRHLSHSFAVLGAIEAYQWTGKKSFLAVAIFQGLHLQLHHKLGSKTAIYPYRSRSYRRRHHTARTISLAALAFYKLYKVGKSSPFKQTYVELIQVVIQVLQKHRQQVTTQDRIHFLRLFQKVAEIS